MDFKLEIAKTIGEAMGISDYEEICKSVENPPSPEMGDFAYPCFKHSKELRKAPNVIAKELCEKVNKPDFIDDVKVMSAYVNFYLNREIFAKNVVKEVFEKKENYGKCDIGKGGVVTLDYSSPNIAKPFHIGHLRTTVIGQALYNIYNFLGYKSIGINHLGDWGTQFGKLIVAYKNWGEESLVEEKGIPELNRLYVLFHEEAEKNPDLNEEARSILVLMQNGDEESLRLWKWFVDISLKEFNRVYKLLNIEFDYFTGESFYNDKMQAVADELKEKGLLKESNGAMVVDLEESNMPPCLILRTDGGTLYPTRDIAAAIYRKNTFNFVKSLYVVGAEQSLHFDQWFKVIELMGYEWAKDLAHIPFGLVNLESGKLSTRKGNVILLEDLLNEAVKRTLSIIEEKNPNLEDKEEVAAKVGIGAVIFNDLYNGRIKDVTFSFDRVLSFDGETGPYVQYTYARASSILSKGEFEIGEIDSSLLADEASFECLRLVYFYTDKVEEAANKYEPFIVTRYLVQLASAFNRFYHDNSVLNASEETKKARLSLVYAVKTVLKSGLKLLGIEAPERM